MARVLERGDIYFLYRPRVDEPAAHSLDDVQRLYVILHARERGIYRRLVVGRKRMPAVASRERFWAHVDRVATTPEPVVDDLRAHHYATKARGVRALESARPVGEGVYTISDHDGHGHLAYRLELPLRPGDVQRDLEITAEASFVVAVFNPDAPPRTRTVTQSTQHGTLELPAEVRALFAGRRFAPVTPELLDVVDIELVLIAAGDRVPVELGIALDPARENARIAELFDELALDRREHPVAPLITGEWA